MASKFHFHAFQAKEMEISSDLLRLSLKETPLEGGASHVTTFCEAPAALGLDEAELKKLDLELILAQSQRETVTIQPVPVPPARSYARVTSSEFSLQV
ncbi:hypothetical protein RRG08_015453 [Elysia crispata]|uniref:Uncharacterized protein n=1 Tax=Elysia crispata TaxID=231223 RepID=A0AAE1CZE6_9GAST|nr:hypothetical protein RRG08_015453 [Elysia crispata]